MIRGESSILCRPILLITRMITDRIGLHSVLLPLLIFHDKHNSHVFSDTCTARFWRNVASFFFIRTLRKTWQWQTVFKAVHLQDNPDHINPYIFVRPSQFY